MTRSVIRIADDGSPWEQLFGRSVALELGLPVERGSVTSLEREGRSVRLNFDPGHVSIDGENRYRLRWDVHPRVLLPRRPRNLILVGGADLSPRIEELLLEMRHAVRLSGGEIEVVVLGHAERQLKLWGHQIPEPDERDLLRLVAIAAAAIVGAGGATELWRMCERAGVVTVALSRDLAATHHLDVFSSIEALELMESTPAADQSAFAPEMMQRLEELGAR